MILLTGATGFVGGNLIEELLKNNYRVRCLVRDPQRAERLKGLGCEIAKGDVRDLGSVVESIDKNIDTVIHLVGILVESKKMPYRDIHVLGTSNVLFACKKNGVRRYLHISALGTRKDAKSGYHMTKWEAEELVRGAQKEFGLDYTIFRPSVMFGNKDRFTNMFAGFIRLFPFIFMPGSGKNLMQPVFVKDLAKMMTKSIGKTEATNRTFEVGGPDRLTFDGVIDNIAEALGKKVLKIHVPMPLMKTGAFFAEILFSKPPVSRDALIMLGEDNITDDDSIERVFGIKRTGFLEGMRTYLH